MKKLFLAALATAMAISFSVPAFAYEYSFDSGADSSTTFGKSTSSDALVAPNPEMQNVRRNKDAAYSPPSYGIFSGDIPTNPSSLYHDNTAPNAGGGYEGLAIIGAGSSSTSSSSNTGGYFSTGITGGIKTTDDYGGILPSTSVYSADVVNTLPLYYDDGSIGTLSIPKINLSVKVYEGETLDNMKVGVGHFEYTSAWDGNVGFAGHNRGASAYFGGVKNLAVGDTISYTTKYGTRTYKVFYKEKINDTDYSNLGWATENIVTLITCVENVPNMRWCVQARELK